MNKALTATERMVFAMENHKIGYGEVVKRVMADEGMTQADAVLWVSRLEAGHACPIIVAAAIVSIIVDRDRAKAEAIEAWSLVEKLRAPEGNEVVLLCDNADFGGANSAIEVCADWTGWDHKRFTGDTVLKALRVAAAAIPAEQPAS